MDLLQNLPNELLVQTLSYLPNCDLASTSQVSRRLLHISLPLLYREPHLVTAYHAPTSPEIFLNTLLTPSCESFARYVRCVTIDWRNRGFGPLATSKPFLLEFIARLTPGQLYLSEVRCVVLLMRQLPHLQALHLLRSKDCAEPRTLLELNPSLDALDTIPPTSHSLRDFTYQWTVPTDWIETTNLLTLLRLPHIRSIDLSSLPRFGLSPDEAALVTAAAATSSLTHLTLRSGTFPIASLQSLLKIPRGLTHFSYFTGSGYRGFRLRDLGLAMAPLRHTLTSLVLDIRANHLWERTGHPRTSVGSFRDWVALRRVKWTLLPELDGDGRGLAEALPIGVRELEILDDALTPVGEAVEEVVRVLGDKGVAPALERVAVYTARNKEKKLRKRLRKACWAAGVAWDGE